MTFSPFRALAPLIRLAVAVLGAAGIAACGGSVSAPASPVVNSPTLSILPNAATMYSGLPTTFILSGGTGVYVVTSSDQAILPVAGSVVNGAITLVPNPVAADTAITLTVRDTGSATPVTATVTVRPGTVANNLTIKPSSTQDPSCNPAVCSGADALVTVTISRGGVPLSSRTVRFSVESGDFTFITTPASQPPARSVEVITDQLGVARARILVAPLAASQTALLRATDVASGAYQLASFPIAQFTGNATAFFTVPATIKLTGPYKDVCPTSTSADVTVFGGSPPYRVSGGTGGVTVSPSDVIASGDKFSIVLGPTAPCIDSLPFAITDATGRTITMTLQTVAGSAPAPTPVVPITLAPEALTMFCGFDATIAIVGGTGTDFVAGSNSSLILPSVATRVVTLKLKSPYTGQTQPITVTVTDGTSTQSALITIPASCP